MFGLNLIPWAIAGFLAIGVAFYVANCEKIKSEQAHFIASLESQAADQERRNKETADAHQRAKEQADADVEEELDDLHAIVARLRNAARSSASLVPAATAASSSPERACFDRSDLDRTLRNFTEGVADLIGEGEQAVIELDGAKGWALKLSHTLQ
jgi:hypothetical protein